MERYKGIFIDGAIIKNRKEADEFLKQQSLNAFKRDIINFYNKPYVFDYHIHNSDSAQYLIDVYGYTWDQIEQMEIDILKEEDKKMSTNSYENIIKNNAKDYYETGKQKLSDDVFDAIVDKVKEENPDSEVLTTGWGYKPDDETKIKHKYHHVGSLDKLKTYDDITRFFKSKLPTQLIDFHISAKLDGMSVVVYYVNGVIDKALTRGDGEYGIDITDKLLKIDSNIDILPDINFTGAVRGEIFMTPTNFNKYKKQHPEAKNPRNTTAGIINSIDPVDFEYLSFYVYTIFKDENKIYTDIADYYTWLCENFNGKVVPHDYVRLKEENFYNYLDNIREKYSAYVSMDGLVLSVMSHDTDYNYNIKQAAFKFQDEIKVTKVIYVEWTMSKHGAYIPVVCIEPIELEGTTVQRVSGYNANWIVTQNIKKDSIVAVRKANQIIPQIVSVLS